MLELTHIRSEFGVGSSRTDIGIVRVVEMTVKNLLGKGERSVETANREVRKVSVSIKEYTRYL